MKRLADFRPQREVPAYESCMLTAIHERLHYEGVDLLTGLLANLNMISIPAYHYRLNDGPLGKHLNPYETYRLGYREFTEYLGTFAQSREFASFEEGLDAIAKSLADNKPMLVFGSIYYLPYTKSYLSPAYLNERMKYFYGAANHSLLVTGITEEAVDVYDPIPAGYSGPLALEDFERFWKGDKHIPELQGRLLYEELYWTYGYIELAVQEQFTVDQMNRLAMSTLKTIADEFQKGACLEDADAAQLHFFGHRAGRKLGEDLQLLFEDSQTESWAHFANCVFEMRKCRYFVRDLLQALAEREGENSACADLLRSYQPIVVEWEKIGNAFQLHVRRKQKDPAVLHAIQQRIFDVTELELQYHHQMSEQWADVPLLSKEQQANEQAGEE